MWIFLLLVGMSMKNDRRDTEKEKKKNLQIRLKEKTTKKQQLEEKKNLQEARWQNTILFFTLTSQNKSFVQRTRREKQSNRRTRGLPIIHRRIFFHLSNNLQKVMLC